VQAKLAIQRKAEEAKARRDAEEASRLSKLIAQDVQRKEEQLAEWEKIQQDESGDGLALELGPNGEREASVQIWQGQAVSEARAKLGNATGGDWLGTLLPAEVMLLQTMAFQPPSFAATASVFNILAPYFHTPQGEFNSNLLSHRARQLIAVRLNVQANASCTRSRPISTEFAACATRTCSPCTATSSHPTIQLSFRHGPGQNRQRGQHQASH
jgi:hypothetical protein